MTGKTNALQSLDPKTKTVKYRLPIMLYTSTNLYGAEKTAESAILSAEWSRNPIIPKSKSTNSPNRNHNYF